MCIRDRSAYRPQRNANPYGVYQQLLYYYTEKKIDKEPLQAYDDDLSNLIQTMIRRGDHVILMIDANEDLSKTHSTSFQTKMANVGLHELILQHHHTLQPPATRSPGRKPIDTIFCSYSINVTKAGYGPFNGFSDHRLAWIDVERNSILGSHHRIAPPIARRLKCNYPDVVSKYIQNLENLLFTYDIYSQVEILDQHTQMQMNDDQKREFEYLDQMVTQSMLQAEKKCRKLQMGNVPFSPRLALLLNTINLW